MNCVDRMTVVRGLVMVAFLALAGCALSPGPEREERSTSADEGQQLLADFRNAVAQMDQDPAEARSRLSRLHRAHPELPGPLVNLCILDFRADRLEDARDCFQRVLSLAPGQPDALNHLGVMARREGRFEVAEDYYRQALASNPGHPPSVRNLGILLDLYLGQHREALALYQRYQSLLPEPDPTVSQWIADLENRL